MSLGENIRKFRKSKNISAKLLGDKLNCSAQAILQYERNERTPSIEVLNKIAKELSVPVEILINPNLSPAANRIIFSIANSDSKTFEKLNKKVSEIEYFSDISEKYSDLEKELLLNLIKCANIDVDLGKLDNRFLDTLLQDMYDLIEFKLYKYYKDYK